MRTVLLILINIFFFSKGYSQVAIIAHTDVAADSITKNQLLDFYSGDLQEWENDLPLVIFDLKQKQGVRDTFYKFIGKSSSRMKSIWLKKMLLGEGDPPRALENEKDMLETIARTPGSIGFLSSGFVDKTVKVLFLIK